MQPREGEARLTVLSASLVRGLVEGLRLPLEGLGMLLRERSLWSLASVPVAFCGLALLVVATLLYQNAGPLYQAVAGWLPALEAMVWYQWLWLGPAKLLLWLVGALLFALACAVSALLALLLANLASAPFLDQIAQRVECIVVGSVSESGQRGWAAIVAEARRSLASESQRLAFFIGVSALIWLGGVLLPAGMLLAPAVMALFTAAFLPLDYAGYQLDRAQVSFARRRSWLRAHLPVMLGFGGSAMATALVPGLNLLLLPALVVAGTLLALRNPVEG